LLLGQSCRNLEKTIFAAGRIP